MTREEFEAFMEGEQWTPSQRAMFRNFTPVCAAPIVRNEMKRIDGIIEVVRVKTPSRFLCIWRRLFGAR